MPFDNNYTVHLSEIIKLIEDGKINGQDEALAKFNVYLDFIQGIGPFDIVSWALAWRKTVWKFGQLFEKQDPIPFIRLLDARIDSPNSTNREVLEFIRSEIIVNFLPRNECQKQFEKLISQYPFDPEFRHSLGHFYAGQNKYIQTLLSD